MDEVRTITVKLLKKRKDNKKFACAIEHQYKYFVRASSLLKYLLRRLGTGAWRVNTVLKVKYDAEYHNETIETKDPVYFFDTTIIFLEDYLKKIFVRDFKKKLKE